MCISYIIILDFPNRLAPLAPMVIPGSQYSNFISSIFCSQYQVRKARVQIDCCCCPHVTEFILSLSTSAAYDSGAELIRFCAVRSMSQLDRGEIVINLRVRTGKVDNALNACSL